MSGFYGIYQDREQNDLKRFAWNVQKRREDQHGCGKNQGDVVSIRTMAGADAADFGRIGIGVVRDQLLSDSPMTDLFRTRTGFSVLRATFAVVLPRSVVKNPLFPVAFKMMRDTSS